MNNDHKKRKISISKVAHPKTVFKGQWQRVGMHKRLKLTKNERKRQSFNLNVSRLASRLTLMRWPIAVALSFLTAELLSLRPDKSDPSIFPVGKK